MTSKTIHAQILANKAESNLAKWGEQPLETLALVAAEEMGELARATWESHYFLNGHFVGNPDRIRQEAIDLGAVCLQILEHFK